MKGVSTQKLLIWITRFVSTLIVLALTIRVFLRLFGANPEAGFAQFIYEASGPLLIPFERLFGPYIIEPGNILEISTIIAILLYIIIFWLITELIAFITYRSQTK